MCTGIATTVRITGSAKTREGWFAADHVTVSFDHASKVWAEHALRLDVVDSSGSSRRVALELDLASGRRLVEELSEVLAAAERSGIAE